MRKKRGAVYLYFDNFYSLIFADNIVIYLPLVIIYGNVYQLQIKFCNDNENYA